MKNIFKSAISWLLVLCICLGNCAALSIHANAEEAQNNANTLADILTINKTNDGLDENDCTNVTLTVPGEAQDYSSDIAFIIGNGPADNYNYLVETIHKMLIAADGTPTKIKLALIGFADTTENEIALPLTEMVDVVPGNKVGDYRIVGRYNDGKQYTETAEDYKARKAAAQAAWEAENPLLTQDMEYIIAKALEKIEDVYSGINLESSLITARDILVADKAVPAERKHMIVVSTGLTYWFDNDAGEPVTIVGTNIKGNIMHGNKYWLQARDASTNTSAGYYMKGWMLVNGEDGKPDYQASWNRYWGMIESWIAADQNAYVYNPGKTYSEFYYNGNSTEIRPDNNANYRYGSAIQNADDLAKVTGAVPYFAGGANPETTPNAAHALNYERAQYEAMVVYRQMETPIGKTFETVLKDKEGKNIVVEGLGFNCYSIANGVSSNPGEEDRWLASNQIGYNFMRMLGGENTVNYRDADTSFFQSIENKILYYCSANSRVEDIIGFEEGKGNFEFIKNPEYITMTVGGVKYTTTQIETKEGYEFSLAFTAPGAEEPTFWLDYTYGDGKTNEKFVWTFGENVSRFAPAALTYKLQLIDKNEAEGDYVIDTNISATLYPVDSDGNERKPEVFPVPKLEYKVEYLEIVGRKTWDDNNNQDGMRPEKIVIKLWAGEELLATKEVTAQDEWSWDFGKYPVYKNGQKVAYTITEDAVEGYESTVTGFNVTNVHVPETSSITVTKVWSDAENQDGKRPASITARLFAQIEGEEAAEVAVITLNAENKWTQKIENLPVYKNGKQITYTVTEDKVDGYDAPVINKTETGFEITNTRTPEITSITVNKVWNDAENQDGKRPASVTVRLFAQIEGEEAAEVTVITLNAENKWTQKIENLPVYKNGKQITYTVTEDKVEGYNEAVITKTETGFEITNTRTPEITSITVNKTWNDANDQDGKRPGSITVTLLANGEKVTAQEITAEMGWTYTFENLPVYANGQQITYTVTEDKVEGYNEAVITKTETGFEITNVRIPEQTKVVVNKIWVDDDDFEGKRPGKIVIRLYADNVEIRTQEVTADNEWTWTFDELPVYANGQKIVYTITEDAVEEYKTLEIEGNAETGFTVTNQLLVDAGENPPPLDPIPDTGDNIGMALLATLMSIMGAAVCVLICKKRTANA